MEAFGTSARIDLEFFCFFPEEGGSAVPLLCSVTSQTIRLVRVTRALAIPGTDLPARFDAVDAVRHPCVRPRLKSCVGATNGKQVSRK